MTYLEIAPLPLKWTPELVEQFWDLFAASPLTFMSFSRQIRDTLAAHVESIVPSGSRVLDFGAGDGDLAEALLAKGYFVGVYEQSAGRIEAAHDRLHGFDNFLGYISPKAEQVFDAVCAFEVLEHILEEEVAGVLQRIYGFLDTKGIFLGSVPNNENLLTRQCICPKCGVMFHRWQHMRSFDHNSLKEFILTGGFAEVSVTNASFSNSLVFVASAGRK